MRARARTKDSRSADASPAPAGRGPFRDGTGYCIAVFLAVRVGLLLVGLIGTSLLRPLHPVSVPGWAAHAITHPGLDNLFTSWERFDGLWFLRIATHGYAGASGSAAFFPLYPLAVRAVSASIGGHPYAASLLVSNAAFLGALIVLYALTASEFGEQVARRTVLFLAVFPTSLFFFAPYSESLFFLLTVTSFWAARRGRWPLAGLAGALAALTRSVGLLLGLALAVEAVHQFAERREAIAGLARRLPWVAAIPAGPLVYLAYWKTKSGDWLAPLHQQVNWQRVPAIPWTTVARATADAFTYPFTIRTGAYWTIDWLVVLPVFLAAIYGLVVLRPAYSTYIWSSLLVPLLYVFPDRPLLSMPRFVIVLFPAFWAMALGTERLRIASPVIVGTFSAGLGLLTVLFVNWYYIF